MRNLLQIMALAVVVAALGGCAGIEFSPEFKCKDGDLASCAALCESKKDAKYCIYTSCELLKSGDDAEARKYSAKVCEFDFIANYYGGKISCILNQNEEYKNVGTDCTKYLKKGYR